MGIEITVIDASDTVGWLASAVRIGEIYMQDVNSMVDNVKKEVKESKISRLNILDHGNSSGIQIGSDWINVSSLPSFDGKLRELRPYFDDTGIVHLQHCNVGQNPPLLLSLARIFGVSVYAGTGAHNPVYRINFGYYVRANPDGTFSINSGRP